MRTDRTHVARPGAVVVAVALLAVVFETPAATKLSCVDGWGNAYVSEQDLSTEGLQCVAIETLPQSSSSGAFVNLLDPDRPRGRGLLLLQAAPRTRIGVGRMLRGPTSFDSLIETVARDSGQDANLLRAIIQVESGFDPNAVSAKGAIGLMQVMPATARDLGLADPKNALYEPESNLKIGALYLGRLLKHFAGRADLAIAAYNAGEGAVVRHGYAVPPFPETQGYVRDVLAAYGALRALP